MRRSPTSTAIAMAAGWPRSRPGRSRRTGPGQIREGSRPEARGWLVREQRVGLARRRSASSLRNASLADSASRAAARLARRVRVGTGGIDGLLPQPDGARGSVEKLAASAASRARVPRPPSTRLAASGTASTSWTARSRCLEASTKAPADAAARPADTDASQRQAGRRRRARGGHLRQPRGARRLSGHDGRLERPGVGHVVAPAFARQQAVVDRLLQQGVTEGVTVARADDQLRVERDRNADSTSKLRHGDHRRDRGLVDADTRDRHGVDDDPSVIGQRGDAGQQHLRHAGAARHPPRGRATPAAPR